MTDLNPRFPLSQVVFIHDYVQLVVQEERFSLFNLVELKHPSGLFTIRQHRTGSVTR